MATLEGLMGKLMGRIHQKDWPPPSLKDTWGDIENYRVRFENDRRKLIQGDTRWHRIPRSQGGTGIEDEIYTPVPVAYEMGRISSALLFSEQMDVTHDVLQKRIDEIRDFVDFDSFFLESGEYAAVEGVVGVRIVEDEEVSDLPLLSFVHGDQVVWDMRYGRYCLGGAVITERSEGGPGKPVWRLVTEYGKGFVERTLFKGTGIRLGVPVPLTAFEEFADLEEFEDTGLDIPTLIRWDNVPGGRSDLYAVMGLLERIDEAESLFLDKGRKSVPYVFGDRTLADDNGVVRRTGMILTGSDRMHVEMGEEGKSKIEVVQPGLQAQDHKDWSYHLLDMALSTSGYSLATWGRDPSGGQADSGKALKLRQTRTLLQRAAKDRMSRNAIRTAVAISLALSEGAKSVKEFMPEVQLGDGMPEDPIETAQELEILKRSGLMSDYEGVSRLHPDWDEERIEEELERIAAGKQATQVQTNGAVRGGRLRSLLGQQTTNEPGGEEPPPENGSGPPKEE